MQCTAKPCEYLLYKFYTSPSGWVKSAPLWVPNDLPQKYEDYLRPLASVCVLYFIMSGPKGIFGANTIFSAMHYYCSFRMHNSYAPSGEYA